ncbi:DEAD/DEAH box helicase family protein [Corynebacterium freneyi]|uniref:Type I restriction enzyme R subunit n=1 Tax=Corynebacterium freneyi TaxID=134034 RepID=A0ABS4U412_9CORY|nr:DEAD/DEAH box helicase family protein [Corynebacterium freneyi]MBP2331395.1 type I restriction enzyme R subunit [Corynebacterium freneyi]QXA52122.1 DEAD/DEAH box helicase family protein [Corynebacterium freneyi]WJZ06480.1 Type-1 restriction enzyme R protein [Corynebacterium freneyi]
MSTPTPLPSNFGFLHQVWPQLTDDTRHAEANALTNPRGSGFHSRRVLEMLVAHITEVLDATDPYTSTLNDRLNNPTFRTAVPPAILDKMHVVRKRCNDAVHDSGRAFTPRTATRVLQHLFDIALWAANNYALPLSSFTDVPRFDTALLEAHPRRHAQTQEQLQRQAEMMERREEKLDAQEEELAASRLLLSEEQRKAREERERLAREAARFQRRQAEQAERQAQTEAEHAEALAELDRLKAELDRKLRSLDDAQRDEIVAGRSRTPEVDTSARFEIDEATTRTDLIDPMLASAGFSTEAGNLIRERRITGLPTDTFPSGTGYADYALLGDDGRILGIVEAKRTATSQTAGHQQAQLYADGIEAETGLRPVIMYTNGHQIWLWDDASSIPGGGTGYPPREIEGYPTPRELRRMVLRRTMRQPLAEHTVDTSIAGGDGRDYQVDMIRGITERLTAGHRRALLVMATGTGKTRTAIALVKLLQQANWVRQVLFLADRTDLVRQAAGEFAKLLPDTPSVNLLDNRNGDGSIHLCTYQTMIDMIDADSPGGARFTPFDYDLIIIDEAHRSVYNRYGRIFEYFDSFLIGLTATPREEVDHNTYRLFDQLDGEPTGSYSLQQAIDDGNLVPFRVFQAQSRILTGGVRYDELSPEEQAAWDDAEWGVDDGDAPPEEITAPGINVQLYNRDTIDKVLSTVVTHGIRVAGADRLGKTIIFARNQKHADLIYEQWATNMPTSGGNDAAVITHRAKNPSALIDRFKDPDSGLNVAISVDMLDTGIDVPEVVNLVFFKPVFSPTKFWQMIGRGTRLRPNLFGEGTGDGTTDKREFFIFDFLGNFERLAAGSPTATTTGSGQKSLTQRLFLRRIHLLATLQDDSRRHELQSELEELLRRMIETVPSSSILVRPEDRPVIERFRTAGAWARIDATTMAAAQDHLAHLPFAASGDQEDAKRFDYLIAGMQLQLAAEGTIADGTALDASALGPDWTSGRERIVAIATNLSQKTNVEAIARHGDLLEELQTTTWWDHATIDELETVRRSLRDLVQYVDRGKRNAVVTDFQDEMGELVEIPNETGNPIGPILPIEESVIERKVRQALEAHFDSIAMKKLRSAKPLTATDVAALEQILASIEVEGVDQLRKRMGDKPFPRFLREIVGLDEGAMRERFADLLASSVLSTTQAGFMRLMIRGLSENGSLSMAELFEAPYNDHGSPVDVFDGNIATVTDIRDRLRDIDATAEVIEPDHG